MKTKIPVSEVKVVQDKAVDDYFWKHYFNHELGLCSLCGNKGVVDTRSTAKSAGRLNYCMCPNGRKMRENPKDYPLQTKFNIVINGMKFEVNEAVLRYEDIVALAFGAGRSDYSMTYSSNAGAGSLRSGQSVKIVSDIYFTVVLTNNA